MSFRSRNSGVPNEAKKPASWVAGIWFLVVALVLISAYALSITPANLLSDWRFWAAFASWSLLIWLWMGSDSIPGRRARSRGILHGWLVLALGLVIGGGIGYLAGFAPIGYSVFAGFSFGEGAKVAWDYGIRGRVRYCVSCSAFRWHIRWKGETYCNKCGHRWAKG